ncbi:MAG: 1,4-alpha-glucan branching enzyme, partial [Lachnospiraceae bacterium]
MDKKLYDLMDWPEIEAVVYSECKKPMDILGQHVTQDGLLFQTFKPGAVGVRLELTGKNKTYDMEMVDEAGYFAVLIPGRRRVGYALIVDYGDGNVVRMVDTYSFKVQILASELERFNAGINYELYNVLGAHPMTVDGVEGVHFAVWAPNAWRVSVVGDFNNWDGRLHQMQFLEKYGVF